MSCLQPYEPINTLKPIADDIWIVDGPVIGMSYLGVAKVPFTTRMTIVRLADGALWVHSPTPLTDDLKRAVDALGHVRFVVAPSKLHYWWVPDWTQAYPGAASYAAPGTAAYAKARVTGGFDHELTDTPPAEWGNAIDQVMVPGDFATEVDFFHKPSRTLILTDMIQNFEQKKVTCWHWRLIMKLGGVADPDGKLPYDYRMTFMRHKREVRAAVERMIAWQPARIVISHGRWYTGNAEAELRRAFRWVLK